MTELVMKNFIKQASPAIGKRLRIVSVPPRKEKEELNALSVVGEENIGSCVAFGRPKMPPFLGSFVVLSLIEMFSRDEDED